MRASWWDWDQATLYVNRTGHPDDLPLLHRWAKLQRTKPIAWLVLATTGMLWLSLLMSALAPNPVRGGHVWVTVFWTVVSLLALLYLHYLRPDNQPASIVSLRFRMNNPDAGDILDEFLSADTALAHGRISEEGYEELRRETVESLFTACPLPADDDRRYFNTDGWIAMKVPEIQHAFGTTLGTF
mgnify:CR=1 FL=1